MILRIGLVDMRGTDASKEFQKAITHELAKALGRDTSAIELIARYGPYGDSLEEAVRQVASANPTLIFAVSTRAALLCQRVVGERMPIVFVAYDDPVEARVVQSLDRPLTNATGLWNDLNLHCKRVEMLSRAFPSATKIAVIVGNNDIRNRSMRESLSGCARSVDIGAVLQVNRQQDLVGLRTRLPKRTTGIMVPHSGVCNQWPDDLIGEVNRCQVPAIFDGRWLVERGALISLEPVELDEAVALARIAAKVVKGVPPTDIPIERPRTTRLSINLSVARQMALSVPPWLVASADDVI